MKRIAEVLGVSRSNLADRHNRGTRPRGTYRKADDEDLLPLIRRFVDERPTYGYRRITALVNRELARTGRPIVTQTGAPDYAAGRAAPGAPYWPTRAARS